MIEDISDGGGGDRSCDGRTDITVEGDKGVLEGDINIEIPEDVPKIPLNSTPSVNDNGETALKRLCEAEGV